MRLSIRHKLLIVFILLTTITGGLIGASTYMNWENSAEQDAIQLSQQVLYSKRNYLESYLDERIRSTLPIWFQADVQNFIQTEGEPDPLLINRIANVLENELHLKQDLAAIFLYKENGTVVYQSPDNLLKPGNDQSALLPRTNSTIPVVMPPHPQHYFIHGNDVISIVRGITAGGMQVPHHYLQLDIHTAIFQKLVDSSLWNKGYVFIVDREGKFVYHPDRGKVGQTFELHGEHRLSQDYFYHDYNGQNMLFTALQGQVSGWTYYGALPESDLRSNINRNRDWTLIIMGLLFIAAVVAAYFIASRITRPLIELKSMMSRVETGNFNVSVPIRGHDEIGYLSANFNRMVARLDEMTREVYLSRINETEAALKRLQAQINPHFLYNTLDSIHALAAMEGVKPIQQIAKSLAALFRYNISQEERLVPFRDEIDNLKVYLDIQRVRFQSRYQVHLFVEPSLLEIRVLKFILQPLVENAFTHGLEPKAGQGQIWVSVAEESGMITIRVTDDGVGMEQEQLEKVLDALAQSESLRGQHRGRSIGLANVHQRLKLHYGKRYAMSISSKPGEGTTIEIMLEEKGPS